MTRFEMRMYGSPELVEVLVKVPECPYCAFVHRNVKTRQRGDVSYVCLGAGNDDIRRVKTVWAFGVLALLCEGVTAAEVEAEMLTLQGRTGS